MKWPTLPTPATVGLFCTLVAVSAAAGPPDGRAVFEKWCMPCHAPGPLKPGTAGLEARYRGASETPVLEQRTNLAPDYVKWMVRNGFLAMPPFRKTEVGNAELDAVAKYLTRNNPAPKK